MIKDLKPDAGSVLITASGPCGVRSLDRTCRIPSRRVSAFSSLTIVPSVKEVMSSLTRRMHWEYLFTISAEYLHPIIEPGIEVVCLWKFVGTGSSDAHV